MDHDKIHPTIEPLADQIVEFLMESYLKPIHYIVKKHPQLIKTIAGFLINPKEIILFFGKEHIGIEYKGSEAETKLPNEIKIKRKLYDYIDEECNLLEKIIGFEYDCTRENFILPLIGINEGLLIPTNKGWDKLDNLNWNIDAQNSLMAMNSPAPRPIKDEFSRIVNGLFFDANDSGLVTRHIKWLDFIPYNVIEDNDKFSLGVDMSIFQELLRNDIKYIYPMPNDYKYEKLPRINRFIEVWGNSNNSEPDITKHLSKPENQFILSMKFGATHIHSELKCEWQSEIRDSIKPDFFIVQPDGSKQI